MHTSRFIFSNLFLFIIISSSSYNIFSICTRLGGSSSDRDPPSDKEVDRFEGDVEPTRYVINNATVWMTFFADRGTTFTGFSIEFLAIYTEGMLLTCKLNQNSTSILLRQS